MNGPGTPITADGGSSAASEVDESALVYPPNTVKYYSPSAAVNAITNLAADAGLQRDVGATPGDDSLPVVKLVAMGSDRTFHTCVSALVALWRTRPRLMAGTWACHRSRASASSSHQWCAVCYVVPCQAWMRACMWSPHPRT